MIIDFYTAGPGGPAPTLKLASWCYYGLHGADTDRGAKAKAMRIAREIAEHIVLIAIRCPYQDTPVLVRDRITDTGKWRPRWAHKHSRLRYGRDMHRTLAQLAQDPAPRGLSKYARRDVDYLLRGLA